MQVRTEAGEVEVGTEECFQNLIDALADPDPKVRQLAVCGLAASGDARAAERIVAVLRDDVEDIRQRAAMALGKLGDPRSAPSLIEAARGEDRALHRAAILALGELGPIAVDVLAEEIGCSDPADRGRAAIALGETRDVMAV
jgi:HEAT repeat protein